MAERVTKAPPASGKKRQRIVFVGGAKGGTGKSVVTLSLIDHLMSSGTQIIIVETDSTNPDVARCFQKGRKPGDVSDEDKKPEVAELPRVETIGLQTREGWLALIDLCEREKDKTIVINSKGGNRDEVMAYGPQLNSVLGEIEHEFIAIWVLNLYKDSVNAMKAFGDVMPGARLNALLNECWGLSNEFDVYGESTIKKVIEGTLDANVKPLGYTVAFPKVANRVLKRFFNDRLSLAAQYALATSTIADRSEVARWRKATSEVFAKVLS